MEKTEEQYRAEQYEYEQNFLEIHSALRKQVSILTLIKELPKCHHFSTTCPLCEEKMSFNFDLITKVFYCIKCHESGDVVLLEALLGKCSVLDAQKELLENYEVDISDKAKEFAKATLAADL